MQMPIFDTITQQYLQATQNWFGHVETAGMELLALLVSIQLILKISQNILSGNGNATSMMLMTIKQLITIAILYYLIKNAGTILPALFNSFSQLGVAGSPITSLDPSSVVSEGMAIASAIMQSFNAWGVLTNISAALFGTFCCIATVISYGLIAADLMITLIESYFLVAVSSLFIAFGSTSYTLPMAREYMGMTIGVGIKLMMLYVMIGIGAALGAQWVLMAQQASQDNDWETFLGLAVGAIIYYLIVKHVPARIASAASTAFAISHADNALGAGVASVTNSAAVGAMIARPFIPGSGAGASSVSNMMSGLGTQSVSSSANTNMPATASVAQHSAISGGMISHFADKAGDASSTSSLGTSTTRAFSNNP